MKIANITVTQSESSDLYGRMRDSVPQMVESGKRVMNYRGKDSPYSFDAAECERIIGLHKTVKSAGMQIDLQKFGASVIAESIIHRYREKMRPQDYESRYKLFFDFQSNLPKGDAVDSVGKMVDFVSYESQLLYLTGIGGMLLQKDIGGFDQKVYEMKSKSNEVVVKNVWKNNQTYINNVFIQRSSSSFDMPSVTENSNLKKISAIEYSSYYSTGEVVAGEEALRFVKNSEEEATKKYEDMKPSIVCNHESDEYKDGLRSFVNSQLGEKFHNLDKRLRKGTDDWSEKILQRRKDLHPKIDFIEHILLDSLMKDQGSLIYMKKI